MLKNYLKIAVRNISKNKLFAFVNIPGLGIGLAVCILIMLWVQNEWSYDKYNKDYDNIYRVLSYGTKYMTDGFDGTPQLLGLVIKEQVPDIVNSVRLMDVGKTVVRFEEKKFYELKGVFTDPSIFDVFTLPFIKGDPNTALSEPYSTVLTETMAARYFGDKNPVGKSLSLDGLDIKVTGVIRNIPSNSTLQFDFCLPINLLDKLGNKLQWGNFGVVTYVQIRGKSDVKKINKMITTIAADHNCPQVIDGVKFKMQPLSEVHLDAKHGGARNFLWIGNKIYVNIFAAVAVFVLFLACINYINLSVVRSVKRAKEVGVRKIVGASRMQLIFQYLSESLLYSFLGLVIALLFVELLLPSFNSLMQKRLSLDYTNNYSFLIGIVAITLFSGVVAGGFPALFFSAFKPITIIKAKSPSGHRGILSFMRALIIFQFVLSVLLITGSILISKQIHFIKNKDLGFDKENVIYLPLTDLFAKKYEFIKQKLLENPCILNVSAEDYLWATTNNRTTGFDWEDKNPNMSADMLIPQVGFDFFKTLNIPILQGRSFSREFGAVEKDAFMVNEEAVRQMGIKSPVGKYFALYGIDGLIQKGTIIGVFKDINYGSLREKIEPQVVRVISDLSSAAEGVMLIKIGGQDIQATIAYIKKIWNENNSNTPFEYHFLEETYDHLYLSDARVGTMVDFFCLLTIIISCLGLYGLACYTVGLRTKEIGVRKVLGASSLQIANLISKDFLKLILLASVIACPIAWYLMHDWLKDFAYRTEISWWIFVLSGGIALLIALATISFQAIKAATANPVESLRYE